MDRITTTLTLESSRCQPCKDWMDQSGPMPFQGGLMVLSGDSGGGAVDVGL